MSEQHGGSPYANQWQQAPSQAASAPVGIGLAKLALGFGIAALVLRIIASALPSLLVIATQEMALVGFAMAGLALVTVVLALMGMITGVRAAKTSSARVMSGLAIGVSGAVLLLVVLGYVSSLMISGVASLL